MNHLWTYEMKQVLEKNGSQSELMFESEERLFSYILVLLRG